MKADLQDLQENFKDYVLEQEDGIVESIVGGNDAHLEVYSEGYYLRLVEVLEIDFPRLYEYFGEEDFDIMARAYIKSCPSQYYSVRYFGENLPQFLQTEVPYDAKPVLAELATFDWVFDGRLDAPDAPVLNLADLQAVSPEQWSEMRIKPHPSVMRADFAYNTAVIWQAIDAEQNPPVATLQDEPLSYYFWRQDLKAYFYQCAPKEIAIMDSLSQGDTFADVCENLCQWLPEEEVAMYVVSTLQRWLNDGLLSKIEL